MFEMNFLAGEVVSDTNISGIPSNNPNDYILDNRSIEAPLPGQTIGGAVSRSPTDPRQPGASNMKQEDTALIGGASNDIIAYPTNYASGSVERGGSGTPVRTSVVKTETDPFTGKIVEERSYVATRTSRNGEVVYREII